METLPSELLKLIGLELPLCQLLLVSKTLASAYDEDFYKLYLEHKFPTTTLWKQNSYQELCAKYLRQGRIYRKNKNLEICGLKACYAAYGISFVLTFNGDLYAVGESKNKKLLSSNVIDFDCETYITSNKWYFIKSDLTSRLIMESSHAFKFVSFGSGNLFAATDYNIYGCKIEVIGTIYTNRIIGRKFNAKIKKIIINNANVFLLFSNGNLLIMSEDLSIIAEASDVLELYHGILNWRGKYYLYYELCCDEITKNHTDNGIFSKKDIHLITEVLDVGSIKNCIDSSDGCTFLSDGIIYCCTYDSIKREFRKEILRKEKQIKNITGNWRNLCLIY
jgi:hypothetical protein